MRFWNQIDIESHGMSGDPWEACYDSADVFNDVNLAK